MSTNNSSKVDDGFKKRVGKYVISFCKTEYYGKSLHGQMRAGYQQHNKQLFIFRINPLPLTNSMQSFLKLQQTYSHLKQYSRKFYGDTSSSSSNYTALQFFPKTFESQIQNFQTNPKYFDQMIEKFLRTYSFFYNMKISHGNLLPSNIGITFDSRVKLMDFQVLNQDSNDQRFHKDFKEFKLFVSRVLQKDFNYPYKFDTFNSEQNQGWDHLLNSWHITSSLQPVYLQRKNCIQNIVTGLYKLECSLDEIFDRLKSQQDKQYKSESQDEGYLQHEDRKQNDRNPFLQSQIQKLYDLKMAIRLVQLNYFSQSKEQKLIRQKQSLQQIIQPLSQHNLDYYNSVIIGAIRDFQFYSIDPSRRLFLLTCLIPCLNHEYIFDEIVHEFKDNSQNSQRNLLLGDSLFSKFKNIVLSNLLKKPKENSLI